MSDKSESDDEFESADEGDEYTDESCSDEDSVDEKNLKSISITEHAEIPVETSVSHEKHDVGTVNPEETQLAPSDNVHVSEKLAEVSEKPRIVQNEVHTATAETQQVSLEVPDYQEDRKDKQDAANTEEIAKLQNDLEDTEISPEERIPTAEILFSEVKAVNETIPPDSINEDVEIPAEIASKISTRNISGSRSKVRTKPSGLGAKKLGAVKLSQPPESVVPALAKLDSEETFQPSRDDYKATATPQQASESANKGDADGWNDSGWGSWFAPPKSLISSVSSIKNQIISTVENVVENGLVNIPEPEELAKEELLRVRSDVKRPEVEDEIPKLQEQQEEKSVGFFGGVSNITKFVESTGSSLFSTGLDTLELLGKKTINVLQQSDPGLKRTKAVLVNPLQGSHDRPCLSQVLREAKESGEMAKLDQATASTPSIPKLTSLFELHNGLVHLEALEMLSQQCQSRVTPQIRRLTSQRKAVFDEIDALCSRVEESDDHDIADSDILDLQALEQNLSSSFDRIGLEVSLKKLMNAFREGISDSVEVDSSLEQYRRALGSLALVTSMAVELIHKSAELILMASKPSNSVVGPRLEAETFQSVTSTITTEIAKLGNHHANQTIQIKSGDEANYSTDIYYEASNCRAYLQNALKLMIPVLQSRIF